MGETNATFTDTPEREFVLGQDVRITILVTSEDTDGRHDLSDCVQEPGATTPLHVHTTHEEYFWMVSGSMTVWAGSEVLNLGPGDFATILRNVPHAIKAGPKGARALNITSPASFAELIGRVGTPAHTATPGTRPDAELFMAVTTELGDVVLGPSGTTPADVDTGEDA